MVNSSRMACACSLAERRLAPELSCTHSPPGPCHAAAQVLPGPAFRFPHRSLRRLYLRSLRQPCSSCQRLPVLYFRARRREEGSPTVTARSVTKVRPQARRAPELRQFDAPPEKPTSALVLLPAGAEGLSLPAAQ